MDADKRKNGLKSIINGAIGLVVALAAFAIVNTVSSTDQGDLITLEGVSSPEPFTIQTLVILGFRILLAVAVLWVVYHIVLAGIEIAGSKEAEESKVKFPRLSIVGIMLKKKQSYLVSIQICLILASLLLRWFEASPIASLVLLTIALALSIQIHILSFRIQNGIYGTNEYESRETIRFILENAQTIDFTDDDGKPKRIITDEDLEEIKNKVRQSLANSSGAI